MTTRETLRNSVQRSLGDMDGQRWSTEDVNWAINEAIRSSWPDWWEMKQDTTHTIATNTFIYALPSDCERVLSVWLEQDSGQPYLEIKAWHVADSTSATGTITHNLHLDQNNSYEADKTLKVFYLGKPAELSNDTSETVVMDSFILAKAKSLLYEQRISKDAPAQDIEALEKMMQWNMQVAEDLRKYAPNKPVASAHWRPESEKTEDIYARHGIVDRVRPGV